MQKIGVSISDSPFAYIDNSDENKLEQFTKIQSYILSNEGQQELVKTGRRVWYGGINESADKSVFNPCDAFPDAARRKAPDERGHPETPVESIDPLLATECLHDMVCSLFL